jgi:hypothetical protein
MPAMEGGTMQEWENTLELLRQRGWDYGYVKCLDMETAGDIYAVNLGRGTKRLSVTKGTIEEAVTAISRLAEEVDGLGLSDLKLAVQAIWSRPRDCGVIAF